MDLLEEEADPGRERRLRASKALGAVGLVVLFASSLSLRFVDRAWWTLLLGLMGVGAAALIGAYLLAR